MAYYRSLADRFGLGVTGGSDFHGANKPKIALGSVQIPEWHTGEAEGAGLNLVGTGRFELPTCRLGGGRSIQLSYVPTSFLLIVASQSLDTNIFAVLHALESNAADGLVCAGDAGLQIPAARGHAENASAGRDDTIAILFGARVEDDCVFGCAIFSRPSIGLPVSNAPG